ncbi:MAG: Gfo/Idh/MocA family oxidoreductase [bacterium]|nr:Gfo/Idh/MocA family oxidoreductase [bacterium]
MADVLRYGLIGSGMMGLEHVRNLRLFDDVEVVAASDPSEASRKYALLTKPDLAVFEDHRELLAQPGLDAVIIASPNHTHVNVLSDVLATDLHVLVEKPLCTTVDDCRKVENAAKGRMGLVWVGMEYRYMAPVARLVQEVQGGAVGELRMLAIREHRYPFLPKVGDWNRFSRNTGGTLVEKCCHFFDLMNLITAARPVRVFASGAMDVNHQEERYEGEKPDILDNAYVIVDYEDGRRALLDLCMFAEASRNEQEICAVGDRGKVECFVPESNLVVGTRMPREVRTEYVPVDETILKAGFHHGATYFQHRAFADAIRADAPPVVGVGDGLLAVAVGQAGEISAREKRPVELSELGVG